MKHRKEFFAEISVLPPILYLPSNGSVVCVTTAMSESVCGNRKGAKG
jgi:hypothetical protein